MAILGKNREEKGFTLLELLVVIAIIGILASIILSSLSSARAKSRDTIRKRNLTELRSALELYYNQYGAYPSTGGGNNWYTSDPTNNGYIGYNGGNWIPGLVASGFISALPSDPSGGKGCHPFYRSYVYYSTNGSGYLLLSHCAVEQTVSTSDPFYDPLRPTSYKMCSGSDCTADFAPSPLL